MGFSYDGDGRLGAVTRPNGITTTYTYNQAGWLSGIRHDGASGPLLTYSYSLDENGNRTAVTTAAGTESYGLDALNRITQTVYANGDTVTYTYDAAGNRLRETVKGVETLSTYDAAGQLLARGSVTYTHDANGNLTGAGADSYSWDWANHLAGASVGGHSASYTYDGLGLRVGETVDGVGTDLLWDRLAALPLLVDDGGFSYVQGPGLLAQIPAPGTPRQALPRPGPAGDHGLYLPLVERGGHTLRGLLAASGAVEYLLRDGLGSVRGVSDAGGALVGTAAYDVFGTVRSQSGLTSPLGFTGERVTPQTGLVHLRARDYAPALGRFLSADAVQPNAPGSQGYNLYAYVANNPTTWVDPSGHNVASPSDFYPLAVDYYLGRTLLSFLYGVAQKTGNSPVLNKAAVLAFRVFLVGVACGMTPGCLEKAEEAAGWAAELGSAAVAGKWTWLAEELANAALVWPKLPSAASPFFTQLHSLVPTPMRYLLGMGIGFVPLLGDIYDGYVFLSGYDPITGEAIRGAERALMLVAVLPGVTGAQVRLLDDVFALSRQVARHGDEWAGGAVYLVSRGCSFEAETPVTTEEGVAPIAEVDVGERVLTWDEETDATGYYTVTAVRAHEDPVVVRLTIDGETVETTSEHPFSVDGQWVEAEDLRVGDRTRQMAPRVW